MSPLSTDVAALFRSAHHRPGFEARPQQEEMARAVAEALDGSQHLIVEAPTGVGKSLAYLVPTALHASHTGTAGIISTHTRNLQQQLFHKDLPLASAVCGRPIRSALLKGRRNYLCLGRLRQALDAPPTMFADAGRDDLLRIFDWSVTTPDGDLDTLGFVPAGGVLEAVCSEPGVCSTDVCGPRCFHQRAWERARGAELIIMNHALFFSLLAVKGDEDTSILRQGFTVFDEAQTVESVAAAAWGNRVTRRQVVHAIQRLYNPRTRRGVLAPLRPRGLRALCVDVQRDADAFFERIRLSAASQLTDAPRTSAQAARTLRVRRPHLAADTLSAPLAEFCRRVRSMAEDAPDALQREVDIPLGMLESAEGAIAHFLGQADADHAYWVEIDGSRGDSVALCSAPVEAGSLIGERLFGAGTSTIMTSATLSVGGSAAYFQQRVGGSRVPTLLLDSPFDHRRQMRLVLARGIPAPETTGFTDALPSWILRSVERSRGRALVLFTSTQLMRLCARAVAADLAERGISLLVQGEDRQRHELLEEFRSDVGSVLFGLDSFWTGVDVPGEALEHVVITRLPFAVPSHPLIEARLDLIAQRGGNPFMEFTLPEAVLKFRQGAGRLIRSGTDHGLVTVLDARVLTKSYGGLFVRSLPPCPMELWGEDGSSEPLEPDWQSP
jgi:ATP-dependent DNA helicase DinG